MSSLDDAINRLNQPIQSVQVNVIKTPILTCAVTGKSRMTNRKYVEKNAEAFPGETLDAKVETFQNSYICKEASKMLRGGMSVADVRSVLGSSNQDLDDDTARLYLKNNGSRSK